MWKFLTVNELSKEWILKRSYCWPFINNKNLHRWLSTEVLRLEHASESGQGLVKTQIAGPCPQSFWFLKSGVGLKFCSFNKCPGRCGCCWSEGHSWRIIDLALQGGRRRGGGAHGSRNIVASPHPCPPMSGRGRSDYEDKLWTKIIDFGFFLQHFQLCGLG